MLNKTTNFQSIVFNLFILYSLSCTVFTPLSVDASTCAPDSSSIKLPYVNIDMTTPEYLVIRNILYIDRQLGLTNSADAIIIAPDYNETTGHRFINASIARNSIIDINSYSDISHYMCYSIVDNMTILISTRNTDQLDFIRPVNENNLRSFQLNDLSRKPPVVGVNSPRWRYISTESLFQLQFFCVGE